MKNSLILSIAIMIIAMNSEAQLTGIFIDNRDGKNYKTIKIGTQTWMAENLAYKTESGCWAYNNDQDNVVLYGYLYNWETARQVCPKGWHLPKDVEWSILTSYLGGVSIAGGKMKESDTIHWQSPNSEASNKCGFNGLPGGTRYKDGTFYGLGRGGYWWSSTGSYSNNAWNRILYFESGAVHRNTNYYKPYGLSVRCIKDEILINKQGIVKDVDGNSYETIKIGSQTWMAENLKTTKFNNGDTISNIEDLAKWINLTTGAFCWYNNDSVSNKDNYGALYNFFAAIDNRNLCPSGWHVPTNAEWDSLDNFLGTNSGGKIKDATTAFWVSPNRGTTNESNFSALPGGVRLWGGDFYYIGYAGAWWSSTEKNKNSSWYMLLENKSKNIYRSNYSKNFGFSVRCIKNSK